MSKNRCNLAIRIIRIDELAKTPSNVMFSTPRFLRGQCNVDSECTMNNRRRLVRLWKFQVVNWGSTSTSVLVGLFNLYLSICLFACLHLYVNVRTIPRHKHKQVGKNDISIMYQMHILAYAFLHIYICISRYTHIYATVLHTLICVYIHVQINMISLNILCTWSPIRCFFFGLDQEHDAAQKRPETWRQKPKNTTQRMQNMTQKMQNPTPNLCRNKFAQKFEETKKKTSFRGSRYAYTFKKEHEKNRTINVYIIYP